MPQLRQIPLFAIAILMAALSLPSQAFAQSAEEAFADGNRLFKDDLYWAALLRYQQAADAGMTNPLLDYNIGVTHYKARQYRRAIDALEKAAESPQLAVLAHYNLGLAAYADNDNATALRWFRRARDQERSRRISELATEAIELIRDEVMIVETDEEEEEPEIIVRELDREPRKFSEFEAYARAGFGSDDNVYRTPGASYLDRSNRALAIPVDPVVQSGSFVPVRLGAKYLINSFEHESFFLRYRGEGRFYQGEELTNANEYSNELGIGTEFRREGEKRLNRLFSAFTIAQHQETFFDPDNGQAPIIDGVDIGDRYSYLRYGPELWTRQSWDRFSFRLWIKAQLWNYENTEEVPEYDHEFFNGGAYVQYRFTRTSLLRLYLEGTQRNFTDRPGFNLDGTQTIGNENVEYTYGSAGAIARQRITSSLWFGVKYEFTQRIDGFVGYNDYVRDTYGAELHVRLGNRFDLDVDAMYRIYDFTNAFAFNNPAAGRRTLETAIGSVRLTYDLPWSLRLVGNYRYTDVASSDARIAYERSLFMLSLEWQYD